MRVSGEQEEVGLGLAAGDVVRADGGVEEIAHREPAERERDVVGVAGGRAREAHARRLGFMRKRREAGDLAELRPEELAVDDFLLAHERVRVGLRQRSEELAHHLDAGAPRRAPEEILADRRHAAAREELRPRSARGNASSR